MNDKLLNKWGKTGLLEGLKSDDEKRKCSQLLEECAMICIEHQDILTEDFAGCILPLIRRLFVEKDFTMPSVKFIFDDFSEYYKNQHETFKNLYNMTLDWEYELLEMYTLHLNPNHKLP